MSSKQGLWYNLPMRKGLVLEGGAMRGLFTAGVLDVFMENGITFDGAVGVSAGACFGVNIKSHQIGRTIRYNKRFCEEWRYRSYRSLLLTGDLYGADFCYHELPDKLDIFDTDTFVNDPMEFYVVATDCVKGEPVYHKMTDGGCEDLEWIRASASMPMVSKPVKINGCRYLDGGITDSVPFAYMESIGYTKNVIILTRPKGYRKQKGHFSKMFKVLLRDLPAMERAMLKRHEMYNSQMKEIERREKKGQVLVIRPPEDLGIKRTESDSKELERVYEIGRKTGEEMLGSVTAFLK